MAALTLTDLDLDSLRHLATNRKRANVTITRHELAMLVNEVDRLRGRNPVAVPDDFIEPRLVALRDGFWKGER